MKMTDMTLCSPVQTLTYPIVEMFHSIQGEGCWAGASAFFIRLAGCDVGCWFCDTKESWNSKRHPQHTVEDLVKQAAIARPAMVVLTGGEPLMHDLTMLCQALHHAGLTIHLETSGSHPLRGSVDWITLSPKRFKPPILDIYPQVHELKVVIASEDDLGWAEQQARLVSPQVLKYLQPEWNTPASVEWVFQYVRQHPEWRVSMQMHKFLGVR
jgi:organic radical activating enzyme